MVVVIYPVATRVNEEINVAESGIDMHEYVESTVIINAVY